MRGNNDKDNGEDYKVVHNTLNHDDLRLPENTMPLNNQVAGHFFGQNKSNLGMLQHCISGDVLKPICDKRSQRELDFYSLVWNSSNGDSAIKKLQHFVPKFNGIFQDSSQFIRLEDVTSDYPNPSILDIKVGLKTYDPEASEEKINSETNKYPWTSQLGFRVLGMRVFDPETHKYAFKDKEYGKKLDLKTMYDALKFFINNNQELKQKYLAQLRSIQDWFEKDNIKKFKFISSSLLFVHDSTRTRCTIKMIDFAHVFPNELLKDDNYIFGLNKLIEYFDNLN